MKIIAVIPARFNASRFPGKLMQKLGENTVIWTTYRNVVESQLFDEVFVVTDNDLIYNEITSKAGKAIYSKKEHETGSDRIAEVVENLDCDVVVNVQGDEPFLSLEPLKQLINVFHQDQKQEISLASLKIKLQNWDDIQNPNVVKVITDLNGLALYFSRSPIPFAREKSVETVYYKHIGVYAFRKNALLQFAKMPMTPLEISEKIECLRYLEQGLKIKMIETHFQGIGIDAPEDLVKANEFLKNQKL